MSDEVDPDGIATEQSETETPVETDENQVDESQTEEKAEPDAEADPGDAELAANQRSSIPILYNLNISPAVRCVKIVARLIGLELELRYGNFRGNKYEVGKKFTSVT